MPSQKQLIERLTVSPVGHLDFWILKKKLTAVILCIIQKILVYFTIKSLDIRNVLSMLLWFKDFFLSQRGGKCAWIDICQKHNKVIIINEKLVNTNNNLWL